MKSAELSNAMTDFITTCKTGEIRREKFNFQRFMNLKTSRARSSLKLAYLSLMKNSTYDVLKPMPCEYLRKFYTLHS